MAYHIWNHFLLGLLYRSVLKLRIKTGFREQDWSSFSGKKVRKASIQLSAMYEIQEVVDVSSLSLISNTRGRPSE
jgi:hypothetical protein